MNNDTYYTNEFIAQVGGVTLANINELERYFISVIDWSLFISTEEFEHYERLLHDFALGEGQVTGSPVPSTSMTSPSLSAHSDPQMSQYMLMSQQQQ